MSGRDEATCDLAGVFIILGMGRDATTWKHFHTQQNKALAELESMQGCNRKTNSQKDSCHFLYTQCICI